MKKYTFLSIICFLFFCLDMQAQVCGNCNPADFVSGCNNGIETANDDTGTPLNGGTTTTIQDFPDIFGPYQGSTPEYCTDFTTPATIGGSSSYALGVVSLLGNIEIVPRNACGLALADFTLYDAACNNIAPTGPFDIVGLWQQWDENQICCNTQYTVCVSYDVDCPANASVDGYLPEIYYVEEGENPANFPIVDFMVDPVNFCDGDPIAWTSGGTCEGLTTDDDVVELYLWTGACAPVDPAPISACMGIDDIADVSADLTLVNGNFTCASPPMATAAWNTDCNDPCDPRVMTFYAITRNVEMDCDENGVFDFRPDSDTPIVRYDVTVYPPQPTTEVETIINPATCEQADVFIVEIGYDVDASGSLDGNEICETKMVNAPNNPNCETLNADLTINWTAAEIAGLTGAPAALSSCYMDASEMETTTISVCECCAKTGCY